MNDNVKITVEEYFDEREKITVIRTIREGLATYIHDGREIVATDYITLDFGKKGTTHAFGAPPPGVTPEECFDRDQPHIKHYGQTLCNLHLDNLARRAAASEVG